MKLTGAEFRLIFGVSSGYIKKMSKIKLPKISCDK